MGRVLLCLLVVTSAAGCAGGVPAPDAAPPAFASYEEESGARRDEAQGVCSYESYRWSDTLRKAVARERVVKLRSALGPQEVDAATGCSVCSEDQAEVRLPGLPPFHVCRRMAARVETALRDLQRRAVEIRSVTAYRVGMTRGGLDGAGNRTRFSNHSFGIALDINEEANGLYEACVAPGPACRLRKGGAWRPDVNPLSMTAGHPVVTAMKEIGWRWGGELPGQQKDFMHFSPSGD